MTTARPGETAGAPFAWRLSSRWMVVAAVVWASLIALPALPAFVENLAAYREFGSSLYSLTIAALVALAAAVFVHAKLRRYTARYEPIVLLFAVAGICLIREPRAFLTVFLMANSGLAIGCFVQRRLKLDTGSGLADAALCGALGLGTLILAMMALGSVGMIADWSAAMLVTVPLLQFSRLLSDLWRMAARRLAGWQSFSAGEGLLPSIALLTFRIFAAFTLAVALTPTISADAISYHLPSAIFYAETGSLAPLPGLAGSYLPQAIELLMSLTYLLGGQAAAQFVNPLLLRTVRRSGLLADTAVRLRTLGRRRRGHSGAFGTLRPLVR